MPFRLSDTEWVLIVVAAIYLFECACWVRRETTCLSTLLGRFRAWHSPSFMGNERCKLVMGNPSPLARCFLCEPWPFALSPEGICFAEEFQLSAISTYVRIDSRNDPARDLEVTPVAPDLSESQRHFPFDEIRQAIVSVEKEIHVNGGPIAECASKEQANRLVAMLQEVAAAVEADRGNIIGKHLDGWSDDAAAAARFAELKRLASPLRASCFTLFVLAFVVGPALYYAPWRPSWLVTVMYFVMLFSAWMLAVWDYGACRKTLLGEKFSQRFRHVGMLMLSPASAMRSSDALLRNGLGAFHPLAAAAALCTKDRFAALARPMMLALEHPQPAEIPADPAAGRIDAWFRKKLLKRLNALLRRRKIDPLDLLRPAEPLSDSRSYCPRCHNQFVLAAGTCPDCGGVPLVAYSPNAQLSEECGKA